jgi:two-component system sensor histidine kinase PilS (NtrC family)
MVNEELARRRGVALENQIRISQAVVERMQDGVLIISTAGSIVRCNPMATVLLGLSEHPGPLSLWAPRLALALARWQAGQPVEHVSFSLADGRELSARFENTSSSDGEVLVFVEDMERIKARARQLKLASLGRLTASIAHEIRNPLAAISHAGELLQEDTLDPIQRRLLCIVNDNAARLNRIVGDVLELGRQKPAQPECIALAPLCTQVLNDLVAGSVCAPEVVSQQIPDQACLAFDRSHLYQILNNLLANAIRHGSAAPDSVRVRVDATEQGSWCLHVIDDGPGVAASAREQIFEPFFTTHHQGTGLGLYIARELSVLNNAQLELASEEGAGGHFILTGSACACQQAEANEVLVAN